MRDGITRRETRASAAHTAMGPMTVPDDELAAFEARLLADVIAGRGWPHVLAVLSRAADRPTRLIGSHGGTFVASDSAGTTTFSTRSPRAGIAAADHDDLGLDRATVASIFAARRPANVTCRDGFAAVALPIVNADRRIGLLLLEQPAPPSAHQLMAAARLPLAVAAAHRDATAAVRAGRGTGFIASLRSGERLDEAGLARTAAYWALDLSEPYAAVAMSCSTATPAWTTAASWIENPVLVVGRHAWTLFTGAVDAQLTRVRQRLEAITGSGTVRASAGPTVTGAAAAAASFALADLLLVVAEERGETQIVYDRLGASALLLSVPAADRAAFVRSQLGAVADRTDLVDTLHAWVRSRCRRDDAAALLGLHRNTVGHRMARAAELLPAGALDPGISPDVIGALRTLALDRREP
ncbi:PucR family transcriptional regulator [Desertimonas flava]|uniref:PucR family transcriptional regulator n=1 Tax=Desertimonas flava TaxID=2064846 RepID=UPI000E35587D|nr:helix-turn-helix domain-containing protein [Desertimonas flava]